MLLSMEIQTFCVVWRSGGTLNFKWNRTCPYGRDKAEELLADTKRMGYKCLLVDYQQSLVLGLPETYGED